jgi:hypothetical protein
MNGPFYNYYIVKHNSKVFETGTVVNNETCSDSGNCYLISDLNNTNKREWIMYYDIYPVDVNKINYRWNYEEKFHKIANEFIEKSKK